MDNDSKKINSLYLLIRENAIIAQTNSVSNANSPAAMKIGTLSLTDRDGNIVGTYKFRNGGGGRGFIPGGTYIVSGRENLAASDVLPMTVDGVGYKYRVRSSSGGTQIPDPRFPNEPRDGILIHPDGNVPGTLGCIGIVGGGDIQKDFMTKMDALIQQGGGQYVLKFDDSSTTMPTANVPSTNKAPGTEAPGTNTADTNSSQPPAEKQQAKQNKGQQPAASPTPVYSFAGRVLTPAQAQALGPFAQVTVDPTEIAKLGNIKYGR